MTESTASAELPKQYDHVAAQQRWYRFWESRGYFHNEPDSRTPFSIVIPPPNVTGALHLGHALNNTLQDILIRFKRMQGFNTLWMPGTDHAGIATQAVVERRLMEEEKKSRHDLGREGLVKRIWQWKDQYEARILEQLKQMGASCDWQRTRFTLDAVCARAVRHTFFRMFTDGLIYRGKRLVNWDTFLQTAVSDDEVFHETVKGHFWHFRYPVIDPQPGEPEFVTIATTRPETMLGDTAVAVHPDPAAELDRVERELNEKLSAATTKDRADIESQLADIRERRQTILPGLIKLRDMARDGRKLRLPLVNREIPLVADEWAKPEMGSGCVKITPAHDPNDYEVGRRRGLPMINILNRDGTLNENAGPYKGLFVLKTRPRVVADLEALGLVEKIEDREIDLAHSDRSKTPIEPYLADQWFVRMEQLSQSAMDAVTSGKVKIFPDRYAKGYLDWLGEKRDWPVSRQLWWGHRIPVWSQPVADQHTADHFRVFLESLQAESNGTLVFQEVPDEDLQLARALGSKEYARARIERPSSTFHVCLLDDSPTLVSKLVSSGFEQSEEVLDTWFSSALWPHSTLGWPEQTADLAYYYPTSVLVTSRDIITLWVARMVLTGLYNIGEVPFRDVFIHPKILDGHGETMSKSKGNGVDPLDVVGKFGADALRFGLAYTATETQDVRMPVEFECPHCHQSVAQTQKNRVLPRVKCTHCGNEFSTQWASKPEDVALPRAMVTSERFELARNFCNKLWNAARFALLNLEGYEPAPIRFDAHSPIEDCWIVSRLSSVTIAVTEALETYKFAEAARMLYDFAWDEFCSFYVEMIKTRLADAASRPLAQRVLAHVLDTIARLLHPISPFITEEIWQQLAEAASSRGFGSPEPAAESVMIAPWPEANRELIDERIEMQFAKFQVVLAGLREVRSRQNIGPKTPIHFSIRTDAETQTLLEPMSPYFQSMAGAAATAWGPDVQSPALSSNFTAAGCEVFVDLAEHIDVNTDFERLKKEITELQGQVASKEKQLANEKFVQRAPPEIVAKERATLGGLRNRLSASDAALGPWVLCPNCGYQIAARQEMVWRFIEGTDPVDAWRCPNPDCRMPVDWFEAVVLSIKEDWFHVQGARLLGAEQTVFVRETSDGEIFGLDLARGEKIVFGRGVPPDSTIVGVNFTAQGNEKGAVFLADLNWNVPVAYRNPFELQLVGVWRGDASVPLSERKGRAALFVTWIKPPAGEDAWRFLIEAFGLYSAGRYDSAIVAASMAVEMILTPVIVRARSKLGAQSGMEHVVGNVASFSDQLNFDLPMLCQGFGLPLLPETVRAEANRLRARRNEIAHDRSPREPLDRASTARMLGAAIFTFLYVRGVSERLPR
jgi:valyl-tRNA synthetase